MWENNSDCSNCLIQNCALGPDPNGCGIYDFYINNVIFRNNIVSVGNVVQISNSVVEYNIFGDNIPGLDTTNMVGVNIGTVWNLGYPSPDYKYQLIGDSGTNPAFGAGINGEDLGITGGPTPYVFSLLPNIPIVYEMHIPLMGDTTNMLQVKIKARSH